MLIYAQDYVPTLPWKGVAEVITTRGCHSGKDDLRWLNKLEAMCDAPFEEMIFFDSDMLSTGPVAGIPFDPTLPASGSQIVAGELRSQFTGLNDEIAVLPTQAQLSNDLVNCQNAAVNTALPQTSANSNGVGTLSFTPNTSYEPSEMQAVINKMDELINELRR